MTGSILLGGGAGGGGARRGQGGKVGRKRGSGEGDRASGMGRRFVPQRARRPRSLHTVTFLLSPLRLPLRRSSSERCRNGSEAGRSARTAAARVTTPNPGCSRPANQLATDANDTLMTCTPVHDLCFIKSPRSPGPRSPFVFCMHLHGPGTAR